MKRILAGSEKEESSSMFTKRQVPHEPVMVKVDQFELESISSSDDEKSANKTTKAHLNHKNRIVLVPVKKDPKEQDQHLQDQELFENMVS